MRDRDRETERGRQRGAGGVVDMAGEGGGGGKGRHAGNADGEKRIIEGGRGTKKNHTVRCTFFG